jgi:hypothetical protein
MKVSRWEEYKEFFQINIFRYLVLWFSIVPIIAGFVEQLPSPLPITIGGKTHEIELLLPFNWQLLWISSFFFMLAFIIYIVFCPKFIRKYNSYKDYQALSHDARWIVWEARNLLAKVNNQQKDKLIERLITKKYLLELTDIKEFIKSSKPVVKEKQTILYFEHKDKKYKLGIPILGRDDKIEHSEKGVFYELFGRYSESKKIARIAILVFLILSFVFFLLVLLKHMYSGSLFIYPWIKGMISNDILQVLLSYNESDWILLYTIAT